MVQLPILLVYYVAFILKIGVRSQESGVRSEECFIPWLCAAARKCLSFLRLANLLTR